METELTPSIVRARALAARVPLSHVLEKARVPGSTFYRWEDGGNMRDLTKARLSDALEELEKSS